MHLRPTFGMMACPKLNARRQLYPLTPPVIPFAVAAHPAYTLRWSFADHPKNSRTWRAKQAADQSPVKLPKSAGKMVVLSHLGPPPSFKQTRREPWWKSQKIHEPSPIARKFLQARLKIKSHFGMGKSDMFLPYWFLNGLPVFLMFCILNP